VFDGDSLINQLSEGSTVFSFYKAYEINEYGCCLSILLIVKIHMSHLEIAKPV
jgi:hypothetical protein